jgi:hypothetical protein
VTKQDLVDAVAKRLGVTKARANEITELFFSEGGLIAAELRRGGRVTVSGFGSFETRPPGCARGAESADRQGAQHHGRDRAGLPRGPRAPRSGEPEALGPP